MDLLPFKKPLKNGDVHSPLFQDGVERVKFVGVSQKTGW